MEKIAKLEQEKEHWMLEAQLAKIRLEKDNKKVANKLKNSSSPMIENSQESSIMLNAIEQEDSGTEKGLRESVRSTSLVSVFNMYAFSEEMWWLFLCSTLFVRTVILGHFRLKNLASHQS